MTTLDRASGLMDIASSLSQDEIPFKLRCAICNKLAVNSFRLPCCDQAICENCQAELPESCPVCTHTPVSGDLCKPNKALRTTLKAFLRTEEKKREKGRPQSAAPASPATPADTPGPAQTEAAAINGSAEPATISDQPPNVVSNPDPNQQGVVPDSAPPADENADNAEKGIQEHQTQNDQESGGNTAPDPDTTVAPPSEQQSEGTGAGLPPQSEAQTPDQSSGSTQTPNNDEQGNAPEGQYSSNMGFQMNQSGIPNMGWGDGSAYNQMAQFMPNGMPHPGMGPFQPSMAGMPGMGMDPMAANQGVFGGYQMGMSGMNNGMNMGMNNFNSGQGMFGGWDQQNTMWNGGQDKYNPNAFGNGMGADFGAHSGYAGYNMPQPPRNFPHMPQQQQFASNDFQHGFYGPGYGRARGRGRGFVHGGRGRGGFGRSTHGNYPGSQTNFEPFQQQLPQQYTPQNGPIPYQNIPEGPVGQSNNATEPGDIKKFENELCPGGEDDLKESQPSDKQAETATGDVADTKPSESVDAESQAPDSGLREIPSVVTLDETSELPQNAHMGPGHHAYGDPSAGFNGRGMNGMRGGMMGGRGNALQFNGPPPGASSHSMHDLPISPATEPQKGQGVVGAPAAPRAMREGLPNTGIRNRGFQVAGKASAGSVPPSEDVNSSYSEQHRDELKQRSRSGSRSTSRRESRHPQRRHDSESADASESENERASRHERRRRKYHRDRDDRESTHKIGKEDEHRSPSVESSRRTHRSRRDGDRTSTHKSRSSHNTSRRHRSRSPNGEIRYRDRDREPKRFEDDGSSPKDEAPDSTEKTGVSERTSDRRAGKEKPHRREDEDRESKRRGRDRDHDRDRKRSRRDRSESPAESEYSSRHHSRRVKRSHGDEAKYESREKKSSEKARDREKDRTREKDRDRERDKDKDKDKDKSRRRDRDRERGERDRDRDRKTTEKASKGSNSEKDPHTLEREARNRERMLKEQQRREAVNADRDGKGSRGWDSSNKHDRGLAGGRRLSYKYEDEEGDQARAARIEEEREAIRWA